MTTDGFPAASEGGRGRPSEAEGRGGLPLFVYSRRKIIGLIILAAFSSPLPLGPLGPVIG